MTATPNSDPRRRHVRAVEAREDRERAELWRRFKQDGDPRARERLVLAYAPLVKYVAGKMAAKLPAHVEQGDLVSYGLFGLIAAIERFDPERRVKFETFALRRIRGAMVDELRMLDWVPRGVRTKARQIQNANATLERRLGRAPTDAETAAALGLSADELHATLLDISTSSIVALDAVWAAPDGDDRLSLHERVDDKKAVDPAEELDSRERREQLSDAIARLPERERLVIALYYYENLQLSEIAEVLGVTESRVSQLRTKAVLRMQAALEGDQALDVEHASSGRRAGRAA